MEWEKIDDSHDQVVVPGGRLIRMAYWVGHDKHYTMCFVPEGCQAKTLKEKINERKQTDKAKVN